MVFGTTYALILPAVTMEKGVCEIPEHTHSAACYTQVLTVSRTDLVCGIESVEHHQHIDSCYIQPEVHTHAEDCYRLEQGELICQAHVHTEDCDTQTRNLICGMEETEDHSHDDSCYETARERICGIDSDHPHTDECYGWASVLVCELPIQQEAEPVLICEKPEILLHEHSSDCYGEEGNLICGKTQVLAHQHTDACFQTVEVPADTETLTCTLPEDENHTHNPLCYGTWELTCGMEEHIHSETCQPVELTGEEQARVDAVMALIDALPTSQELEERAAAFDEAGDEDGYEDYLQEITRQAQAAYVQYEDLGPELQALVTNREKLLALEPLWSASNLIISDNLTVYQVNSYSAVNSPTKTILVYGGSVREKLGSGMAFTYWKLMVVEEDTSGKLYVAQYVTEPVDKRDYGAETGNGFLLLMNEDSANAVVGDEVTVSFDYRSATAGFRSDGYGTVSFQSGAEASLKPEKDNSGKLNTVLGADTRDVIEVNLYDYGVNINDLYNSNNAYPGFQQENGSTNVGDAFDKWASFNFGNNITCDLAAGQSGVTVPGGTGINATTNNANSPISGAMLATLGSDGYPALADGTSLSYLFRSNPYATKKNAQSINGLFQYNSDTGAYSYNSRENHAQFNPGSDTFTLYRQIITSNFMMYPFGNFLPLNDIVHLSAQTSVIDKDYLTEIAQSAQYKYARGDGDAYGTLSTQLRKFIGLMDAAYPDGWTEADCMNEYFALAGLPRRFTSGEGLLQNLYTIDYDEPTNFYIGMEMKMNFMQPKGGFTGKNGQHPMQFSFSGDDDVWVYVDGRLFLDLSGIHRHVGGEIDFVNGEVRYYSLDVSTGDVSTSPYKTVPFSQLVSTGLNEKGTFADYSQHSFHFYYMERGSGSGVCRMNFNFPLLRKNTISVSKALSVDEEGKLVLLGNPDFRFQILKENGTDLFIGSDVAYDILNASGNKVGSGTTDENGVFVLKADQTAVFKDIPENAGRYFVRELLSADAFAQYGQIKVDGVTQTTNYDVTVGADSFKGVNSPVKDMSDGSTVFTFNNQVTFHKLGSLKITKILETYSRPRSVPRFAFLVTLDGAPLPVGTVYAVGEDTKTVEEAGIIHLAPGETAVISDILAGSAFAVEELAASAEGYYVTYAVDGVVTNSASGIIQTDACVSVSVTNSEKGASLQIPVEKLLEMPDGKEHHYVLLLEQVTDSTGETLAEPAYSESLTVDITTDPVAGAFTLNYIQASLKTNPAVFYYRITEQSSQEESKTVFDSSQYVVEVTVSHDSESCRAAITSLWKDGQRIPSSEIVFVNRIIHYELPATGGTGTALYVWEGFLLMTSAAFLLLYNVMKRRKICQPPDA